MSDVNVIDGIDYGPLAALVGTWKGDKGVDKAPEPDGEEKNLYYETIIYEAIGDVDNAETQNLAVLRYHQVVSRKSNDEVFHNETGYWMWDAATGTVMQSLSIPRGVALLAGGSVTEFDTSKEIVLEVKATAGETTFGIVQQPFMEKNAKTLSFCHTVSVEGDKMVYSESTMLDIYNKEYDHTDRNRLTRVVG
ncbi:hypothetical protein EDC56_1875 [Sinobacterium caligoides]|uniref:THAP4-like heme-binding domain-containing protein n=1 Tax=Sinobacterium caligoides TaxID=933926 RepID=A0A3N2DNQ2_9GAMM|nr:heme-binding beta-barrel domain-containing protein [Sinobacterium caligoides]ROS01434.1 hypothetical protein EDC56_1875 [Sinobacterium caligoides]